ncbi:tail fiber domain-containing protein [Paenibacillus sp. HW567]|uniref:tail fiber domain-containing protein n=1 Tax=Paenibacillus sp. HW567 TaxID=1034769 RepID=UPI0003733D1F|nr:tail fiber domain-containing protein [Paenibacillus sp. HW567]
MPKDMKRMHYFNGLLLKEDDLTLDQDHHKRLQRLHNRYFHDWGVVTGLEVVKKEQTKIEITPGFALNRVIDLDNNEEISQEIIISDAHPARVLDLSGYSTSDQIYISVNYKEELADKDLIKGGGKEIHVWEVSELKASSKKPTDVQTDILLARVTMKHNQDGTLGIDGIYDTDVDGEPLRIRAVGGTTLKAKKIIIGSKEDPALPFFDISVDEKGNEGNNLNVHASLTEFTGTIKSGALNTHGAVEVNGELTVKAGSEMAFKVNASGDVDMSGSATVAGPLSAKAGLDVSGGMAVLDVPQVVIGGNMVTLNKNANDKTSSGIEIIRKDEPSAKLVWDEKDKAWKIGTDQKEGQPDGGMYKVAYGADWEKLHGGVNADSLHVHSQLHSAAGDPVLRSDPKGNIVIENTLTVNGSLVAKDGGLEVSRGETLPNAKIAWNEQEKSWQIGTVNGDMTNIPDGKQWEELTGGSSNADALHTHRQFHNEDKSLLALEIGADGNVTIPHELMVGETLTVNKLIVREEEVVIKKIEQEVADSFITVNKTGNNTLDSKGGLGVYRGSQNPSARMEWNETERKWKIGIEGSLSDIPYGNKWDSLTNGSVADKAHKHSTLSTSSGGTVVSVDDQGKLSASGNVEIGGTLSGKGNADLKADLNVGGSATIEGNLTVKGKTTYVNKEELVVTSNRIELNKFKGVSSTLNESSIEVYRGEKNPSAKLVWNESEGRWKLGLGDELSNIAYGKNWDALTGGVNSDADGLHRHNSLSDSKGTTAIEVNAEGNIEITNDAEVKGTLSVNNGADITGGLAVDGLVTVAGNLIVKGTTTTVEKKDLVITDNMIKINKFEGETPPVNESGLEVYRGESQPAAKIIWSESERKWKVGTGSALENIASGSSWDKLTQKASADSLHIHSQLYNPQTDILALSASADGDVDVHHDLTVGSNLTVAGNLEVRGVSASIHTDELEIGSPLITLNRNDDAVSSISGGGMEIFRGTGQPAAQIAWDEDKDLWKIGTSGEKALTVDKAGNVVASGGLEAASANILGAVTAASAAIAGTVSVGDGLEVAQGTETSAQIKWAKDRWKLGTAGKTVLSLTRSGKMGVGTENPTEVLDVAGKAIFRTEAEIAGAASFSGKMTARKEAVFEGDTTFNKGISAVDVNVSNNVVVEGSLFAHGIEVPVGLDKTGALLPNPRIEWDNERNAWFYGDGTTKYEFGTGKGRQNALYNELGDTVAIYSNTVGNVGIGTSHPLALVDVRITGDKTAFSVTGKGNVGIGTSAPDELTVMDVRATDKTAFSVTKTGNIGIGTLKPTTLVEVKATGDKTAFSVTEKGNVGIGTIPANSDSKLEVQGNTAIKGDLSAASAKFSKDLTVDGNLTVNGDLVTINATNLDVEDNIIVVNKYEPSDIPLVKNAGLEVFRGGTALPAQLIWDETADEWLAGAANTLKAIEFKGHTHPEYAGLSGAMTVDSGNIGIGTAKPTAKLDVNGNVAVTGKLTAVDAQLTGKLNAAGAEIANTLTAKDAAISNKLTAKDGVFTGSLAVSQGMETSRGTDPKAQILWNETIDEWQVGIAGSLKQLSYQGHTHPELADLTAVLKIVSGNLGIGTATPTAKLDVTGNAVINGKLTVTEAAVNGTMTAKDASVTGTATLKDANVSGAFTVKDATVNGKLTAKDAAVSGNLTLGQGIEVARGTDAKAQILWNEASKEWQMGLAGSLKQLSYSGHTHPELTDLANLTGVLKLVSGNIGIGTATPTAKLDVKGDAAVSGKLTVTDAAVSGDLTAKDATLTGTLTTKDAALTGKLTAVDAAISGSLAVGKGIEVNRGKDKKAQIVWDETGDEWQVGVEGGMKRLAYSDHTHDELTALTGAITVDSSSNVGIGKTATDGYKLDVNGNLRATNLAQTSSRTFKENISGLTAKKALELLNKLKPVTFNYKEENGKQQNIGFIAEDVPHIFATSDHKSVVLMDIIAVLTTVVQKQQKEAVDMRKQVNELQVQVAALAGI